MAGPTVAAVVASPRPAMVDSTPATAAPSAVPSGGRILILEGSSYPELPSAMTKNIDIEIVDETAVLGS